MEGVCTPIIENTALTPFVRAEAYRRRGYGYDHARRYTEAIRDYDAGLALVPDHPALLRLKGNTLRQLGRIGEALALAERSVTLDPTDPYTFQLLAQVYRITGDNRAQLASLDSLIELKADHAWAYYMRAKLLLASNRAADAFADTTKLLALPREKFASAGADTLFGRRFWLWQASRALHADALTMTGRTDAGERIMNELVADEPSATNFLARALFYHSIPIGIGETIRKAEILADARETLKRDPDYAYAWCVIGELHSNYNENAAALDALDKAIAAVGRDDGSIGWLSRMLWSRALVLRKMDRSAEARSSAIDSLSISLEIGDNYSQLVFDRLRNFGYWLQPDPPQSLDKSVDIAIAACMLDKSCW